VINADLARYAEALRFLHEAGQDTIDSGMGRTIVLTGPVARADRS
jgi:hypothetical protein